MNKARVLYVPALFLGVVCHSQAIATTWFFSSTGSDSNTGVSGSPWLNPGNHNSAYSPGDVLSVAAGTYTPDFAWTLQASGSAAGGYITLQCASDYGSQIRVLNDDQAGIAFIHGASYWDLRGCDVSATGANGNAILVAGIFNAPFGALHHIIIEDNVAHDSSCAGIAVAGNTNVNGNAIYATDYLTIRNNIVYGNALTSGYHCSGITVFEPVQFDAAAVDHIIIQGNVVYANHDCDSCSPPTDGNGIILDDFLYIQNGMFTAAFGAYGSHSSVLNNLTYNNGGKGIQVFESQNVLIAYNSAWGNNQDAAVCDTDGLGGFEIGAVSSTLITIANNEGQAKAATCNGRQIYAFVDSPSGDTSLDIFTGNTGFAIFGSQYNVGYSPVPPSAYFSTLPGYDFGATNQ